MIRGGNKKQSDGEVRWKTLKQGIFKIEWGLFSVTLEH